MPVQEKKASKHHRKSSEKKGLGSLQEQKQREDKLKRREEKERARVQEFHKMASVNVSPVPGRRGPKTDEHLSADEKTFEEMCVEKILGNIEASAKEEQHTTGVRQ